MSNQELVTYQTQVKDSLVKQYRRQIEKLLDGDEGRADKFLAAAVSVLSNPIYQKCSVESIVQSAIGVAMLDLNIDKNVAHCYIVPYSDWKTGVTTAQLQISYKGMIQMLFRAGWSIKTHTIYKCDKFEMTVDDDAWDSKVKFVPNIDERDEGDREWCYQNMRGIYVVARHADTKDQYSLFVSKAVIDKLRLNSPSQKEGKFTKQEDKARLKNGLPIGIWFDWFVEMAQAKAVKKLAKLLPIGDKRAELGLAIDDKADVNQLVNFEKTAETGVVIDIDATEPESKPARKSKSSVDSLVGGSAESVIESVAVTPEPVQAPVAPPVVQEPIEADYSDMPTDLPPIGELRPEPVGTMPIPELAPEPVKNGLVTPPEHKKWIEQIDAWETLTDIANTMRDMPAKIKEDLKEYTADKNAQVKRKIDIGNWVKEISNCNSRADLTRLQNRMPESIRNDETIQYNLSVREDYGINNHPKLW